MPETHLADLAEYERALAQHERVMLFKHSPVCPISAAALEEWTLWRASTPSARTLFVDVIAQRPVARGIADRCGVKHESPQAILFVNGLPVWNASHARITRDALAQAFALPAPLGEIVLASTSASRKALLDRLGVPFRALAPDVDEDAFKARGLPPRELALELAVAKARSVAAGLPHARVIGSDQVCALGTRRFSKPGDRATALAQLSELRGQTHSLWTAVALVAGDRLQTHVEETRLTMHELAPAELAAIVDRDRPFDCAGSYRIEGAGIGLFHSISGADWTAIVGLPLLWLTAALRG